MGDGDEVRRGARRERWAPLARVGWRRRSALASVVLACSGCLEWEEQEIRIVLDREADQLEVQLICRGLYSAEEPGADPSSVATQTMLRELLDGRQRFALLEPLLMLDLERMREEEDSRVATIAAAVAVDHGEFFRDERGRWCAWQHVRVESLSRVVPLVAELVREELLEQAKGGVRSGLLEELGLGDPASRQVQRPAHEAPFSRLALRGGTLALRMPASERGVRELRRRLAAARDWNEWLDELRAVQRGEMDEPAATPASGGTGAAERATGGTPEGESPAWEPAAIAPERLELPSLASDDEKFVHALARSLGVVAVPTRFGVELQLELPTTPGPALRLRTLWTRPEFATDLTEHLEATHAPIRPAVDDAFLAREFAWFRSR